MQEVFENIIEKLRINANSSERKEMEADYFEDKKEYKGQRIAFRDAIDIVKQEAKQYDNGWITCSERLPEIDGNTSDTVLVCCSNGFLYMAFWCDDLQWRFCKCGMSKEPVLWTEIVAWQPLPEPFKERN